MGVHLNLTDFNGVKHGDHLYNALDLNKRLPGRSPMTQDNSLHFRFQALKLEELIEARSQEGGHLRRAYHETASDPWSYDIHRRVVRFIVR